MKRALAIPVGHLPRALASFAVLFLGLLLLTTSDVRAQTYVATKAVRLRQGPSTSDPIVRVVHAGERVALLAETGSGEFYRVRTEQSEEGWIHGHYLVPPPTPETEAMVLTESATTAYPPCGGANRFRWAEKTDMGQSGLSPEAVSVPGMLHWAPLDLGPDLASWCAPRRGLELKTYAVTGWVRRVRKHETDGDWHIEVTATAQSNPKTCIVAEIPDPSHDPTSSTARDALDALLRGSAMDAAGDVTPPIRVRFTGAGFFDGWHSRGTGAQGHGRCNSSLSALWEIHPVFSVASP